MEEEGQRRIKLSDAWREAKGLIVANRWRLALGAVLMLVNRLVGLVLPASSKYIIDEVVIKGRSELLTTIGLAAGAATLLQASTSFLLSLLLGVAAHRAIAEMRIRVQSHVMRLPIRYFDSTQTGKLIVRIMHDADGVRNLIGAGLVDLIGSAITALISVGVLFYLNWRLTTFTLSVLLAFGGGLAYCFRRLFPIFDREREIYSQITGRLGESLGGIRIVKAYTAEKREELIFARGAHRLFRVLKTVMMGSAAIPAFSTIIIGGVSVAVIMLGGGSVLSGGMTLGDLLMYVFFTGMMVMPVMDIAAVGSQITEAFAGLNRVREMRGIPAEGKEEASKGTLDGIKGEIEFEDVCFEYSPGAPVLKNISFTAPAGSTTALVGPSGAGKSTLIGLVMNFNSPVSGRIKVDGRDLATIKLSDYRSHLGCVLQDNFLFDGTIAENISYSRPRAGREEIQMVSRVAHCEEFIESFDDKYETVVGERGVKLSGGQRQRVAIARALLADPRILILDEATSSLDSESEAMIQEGLRKLRKGRTTFVIAHRLSTIRSADQILVMENGKIVEHGTHEALLAADGRYKQLYDKQYRFERDQFVNLGDGVTPEQSKAELEYKAPASRLAIL